jgi:hypothetical protein
MDNESKKKRAPGSKLLRHRQILWPTWRGWLVLAVLGFLVFELFLRTVHSFLAANDSLPGGLLVVEGWMPDYAFERAIKEFRANHYEMIAVTGGPMEAGSPLSPYVTYAELGAATLLKMGMETNHVVAVPSPWVPQDRTYVSAVSLKIWLQARQQGIPQLNLVSMGPHSRRSRLLFHKAFDSKLHVGIICIPVRDYDAGHWWKTSSGVRSVVDEIVGYVYARFFFHDSATRSLVEPKAHPTPAAPPDPASTNQ